MLFFITDENIFKSSKLSPAYEEAYWERLAYNYQKHKIQPIPFKLPKKNEKGY